MMNRLLYLDSENFSNIDINENELKKLTAIYNVNLMKYNSFKNNYPLAQKNENDAPSVIYNEPNIDRVYLKNESESDLAFIRSYSFVIFLFWMISIIYYTIPSYLYCDYYRFGIIVILNAITVFIITEGIILFISSLFINYIHSSDYFVEKGVISFLITLFNSSFVIIDFLIYDKLNTAIENLNMSL